MPIKWEPLEYEGIRVPFSARRYGFSQRLAEHQYPFRDLSDIEMLGAGNPRWSYTLPLGEGIRLKEWGDSDLLTVTLPRFMRACYASQPGTLRDPLYGTQRVVPISYSEQLSTAAREQANVEVEFMLYPESSELPITGQNLASLGILSGSTQNVALQLQAATIPNAPTPENLVNPLQLAQQYIALGEGYAAFYTAQIDAYLGQLEQLSGAIEQASDPVAWQLKPIVDRLRSSAKRVASNLDSAAKSIAQQLVPFDTSLPSLAMELGVDFDELLSLNRHLSLLPIIEAGTLVNVP